MHIQLNGELRELPTATSVAQLLEQLELNPQRVAVEVNGELAPRTQHHRTALAEDDQVEIVTLAGGG
ncbi:MAG: sulfur carrier protein ThiS [Planctomycetales bacterium]|nr:sulfur carrier protein ThiS [Planctomycetales bacterium]